MEKNIHNVCGKEIGKHEEVVYQDQVRNEQCANNWRSLTCEYFMDTSSVGSMCPNCNLLRRNLSVQLVRFNNSLQQQSEKFAEPSKSKVNKRFLSSDDISDRENDQKRKKNNCRKKRKILEVQGCRGKNMKCLAKDDNDLVVMFKELDKVDNEDKEMFPGDPKLLLFWGMRHDVISKQSKKASTRWHPL